MLGAVIFDFDGVISDSEILHLRAFNQALARHGVEITRKDYYKDYLGLTDIDFYDKLRGEGRLRLDDNGYLLVDQDMIIKRGKGPVPRFRPEEV